MLHLGDWTLAVSQEHGCWMSQHSCLQYGTELSSDIPCCFFLVQIAHFMTYSVVISQAKAAGKKHLRLKLYTFEQLQAQLPKEATLTNCCEQEHSSL